MLSALLSNSDYYSSSLVTSVLKVYVLYAPKESVIYTFIV